MQDDGVESPAKTVGVALAILIPTIVGSWFFVSWLYDTYPEEMEAFDQAEIDQATGQTEFHWGQALIALAVMLGLLAILGAGLEFLKRRRQKRE